MVPPRLSSRRHTGSRLLSVLAVSAATAASAFLLWPNPLADVFFAGFVLLSVLFALVGAIGAWTRRTPLVWVAALLSTGLTLLGILSIGSYLAPATLLLGGAAICSQLAGPRPGVREAIVADPPTEQELVRQKQLGAGAVVGGVALVYVGAFAQELFGMCASETLACALETTNWVAVALTVIGLLAISLGGWLLWKQRYVTRVLAARRPR